MKLDASKIHKILVISLSNIGDVILTFPVMDILKRDFYAATLSVVVGPKAESLFRENPYIENIFVYDKRQSLWKMIQWIARLRDQKFDLVVDLRNTAIPFFLSPKYRTPLSSSASKSVHMKKKHQDVLRKIWYFSDDAENHVALRINLSDKRYIEQRLQPDIGIAEKYFVVAPGAADHSKRWNDGKFARACDILNETYHVKIVFAGNNADKDFAQLIQSQMKQKVLNLCGQTDLTQLAALIERSSLVIANDSAIMHMASYLNVPVVAIFGPTDPVQYGPWSRYSRAVKSPLPCAACQNPNSGMQHQCMDNVKADDVVKAVNDALKDVFI